MIDYYEAMNTVTGETVPYLKELSYRISKSMSADDCFKALSLLREELDDRWRNGNLDDNSQLLKDELDDIRTHFMSDLKKERYDKNLEQAWQKRAASQSETTGALSPSKTTQRSLVTDEGTSNSLPLWVYLIFILLILGLLIAMLVFNINLIGLIIGVILIFALILIMS